jgi:hypothetical protein
MTKSLDFCVVLAIIYNEHQLRRLCFCRHSLAEAMQWVDDILAKSPFIGIVLILIITIGIILKGQCHRDCRPDEYYHFQSQLLSRPLPGDMFQIQS